MKLGFLTEALSKRQREVGFYLEQDDYNILLQRRGEITPVAVFSQHASLKDILVVAEQELGAMTNGVTFSKRDALCPDCGTEAQSKANEGIADNLRSYWANLANGSAHM